ncbi:cation transporter [Variovorax sp. PBL-E5]|uniref:cation transporter n=1 Tax=Variovorax sp. PBL-E5 TaxID=434014 RepID=UPI001316C39C|nr:cation diffusion facilitator family transporter [Variovorax sp. PBL-E5]VTU32447.1 Cadmium, cobalt and zinc/H(+)-K(+) antiporter [Variovorax sp. PBL-E5]
MSANCHHDGCHDHEHLSAADTPRYRRVLWIALALNAAMFAIEIGGGFRSGSVSLLADAIDFFGDAANYGVTLAVLSAGLAWRARAAVLKGGTMLLFGLFVAGRTIWSVMHGVSPEPLTMGVIGTVALAVNLGVAVLLYAFREGDANMRSVWLCSRNDAIGNVAVMIAALGVFGTGTAWPDLAVAAVMGALAVSGGASVLRQARGELGLAQGGDSRSRV